MGHQRFNGTIVPASIPHITIRAGSNKTFSLTATDFSQRQSSCVISVFTSLSEPTEVLLSLSNASDPEFRSRLVEVTRSTPNMTSLQVALLASAVEKLMSSALNFSDNSTVSTVFEVLSSVCLVPLESVIQVPSGNLTALRDAVLTFAFAVVDEAVLDSTSTRPVQEVRKTELIVSVRVNCS
jgi:hypothetical protein